MSNIAYAIGIAGPAVVLVAVVFLLRRGQMRERHSLWWILASTVALGFGIFPDALNQVAKWTGVVVPINLVFFGTIALLFLVNVQHAGELTKLEDRIRLLTERLALLELDLDDKTAAVAASPSKKAVAKPEKPHTNKK